MSAVTQMALIRRRREIAQAKARKELDARHLREEAARNVAATRAKPLPVESDGYPDNLTGQVFGELTVTGWSMPFLPITRRPEAIWNFSCSCGRDGSGTRSSLTSGKRKRRKCYAHGKPIGAKKKEVK